MQTSSTLRRDRRAAATAVARRERPVETAARGDSVQKPSGCPHPERAWDLPQIHRYGDVVVGVFANAQQVEAALALLRQAGFGPHQAGVAVCGGPSGQPTELLSLRDAADGPFDALVELGVGGDAARVYQQEFANCRGILAVAACGRVQEVMTLLQVVAVARR